MIQKWEIFKQSFDILYPFKLDKWEVKKKDPFLQGWLFYLVFGLTTILCLLIVSPMGSFAISNALSTFDFTADVLWDPYDLGGEEQRDTPEFLFVVWGIYSCILPSLIIPISIYILRKNERKSVTQQKLDTFEEKVSFFQKELNVWQGVWWFLIALCFWPMCYGLTYWEFLISHYLWVILFLILPLSSLAICGFIFGGKLSRRKDYRSFFLNSLQKGRSEKSDLKESIALLYLEQYLDVCQWKNRYLVFFAIPLSPIFDIIVSLV